MIIVESLDATVFDIWSVLVTRHYISSSHNQSHGKAFIYKFIVQYDITFKH